MKNNEDNVVKVIEAFQRARVGITDSDGKPDQGRSLQDMAEGLSNLGYKGLSDPPCQSMPIIIISDDKEYNAKLADGLKESFRERQLKEILSLKKALQKDGLVIKSNPYALSLRLYVSGLRGPQ